MKNAHFLLTSIRKNTCFTLLTNSTFRQFDNSTIRQKGFLKMCERDDGRKDNEERQKYMYIYFILYIYYNIYNIRNGTPKILNAEKGICRIVELSNCRIFLFFLISVLCKQSGRAEGATGTINCHPTPRSPQHLTPKSHQVIKSSKRVLEICMMTTR